MESFGTLLRKHRKRSRDPLTGGMLTQARLGEVLGDSLGYSGPSGAAVGYWEQDRYKISADDRRVLVGLVSVLKDCGGLSELEEANRLLHAGNYRALDEVEARQVFPELAEPPLDASVGPAAGEEPASAKATLTRERKNQLVLLSKVRNFWGRGVLDQSIGDATLIDLARQRSDEDVENPLRELVGPEAYETDNWRSPTLPALLRDTDNALLILGDPGAGKTTTLLQLADGLCQLAENDPGQPIPVVLNLVSWAEKRGLIANWIVEELTAKYQIPRRLGRTWLNDDVLALLLDGFDEVPARYQAVCARQINEFRESHGLATIVVCSRTAAYRECGVRLRLGGATKLCPLADEQVDAYLAAAGPVQAGLRAAVRQNDVLGGMAESPLMLRVMCTAYANKSAEELLDAGGPAAEQVEQAHHHLFEAYVQRMFGRRGQDEGYSTAKTRSWLSWLANAMNQHNQDVFLIEQIQPSWLPSRAWRWVYLVATWLFNGLYGSVIMWLLIRLLHLVAEEWPETQPGFLVSSNVILGLAVGILHGLVLERQRGAIEDSKRRGRPGRPHMALVGLVVFGLTVLFFAPPGSPWLAFAWGMGEAVMFVIITRYSHGRTFNTEIHTVEALNWSWRSAAKGLAYGLLLGIASEIIETLLFGYNGVTNTMFTYGSAGLILGGLRGTRVEIKNRPNEGIRLSLMNAIIASALTGIPMIVITWLASRDVERALFTGLMLGIFALLLFGLGNAVKHYVVRALLWYKRCIPWRMTQLLDHSTHLILMRKVGSGYIYVHRMLQDYFRYTYRARPQIDR